MIDSKQLLGGMGMVLAACAGGSEPGGTTVHSSQAAGGGGGGGAGGGHYSAPVYGTGGRSLPRAPIDIRELELIKKTLLLGDDDIAALRQSRTILEPHVDEILETWYGFVGSTPHLLAYFSSSDGKPQADYLAKVRARFGRWILDTAAADYDQDWIDFQFEIGRRHHRVGKNKTDGADAVDHIHFRYLFALAFPITHTLRPFLEKGGASPADVERMHQAWVKSVLLQLTLWSHPYVRDGDF